MVRAENVGVAHTRPEQMQQALSRHSQLLCAQSVAQHLGVQVWAGLGSQPEKCACALLMHATVPLCCAGACLQECAWRVQPSQMQRHRNS